MESVTIIGAGISGLALSDSLRQKAASLKITLIDKNRYHLPYRDIVASPGDISRRLDIPEWAASKGIEFIQDSLDRINPKRKKIFLKKTESRDFETLVVATGFESKKITVKGEHREGFFYLSQIDPLKLKDLMQISAEAMVYVSTWLGIQLILSLAKLGKEVTLVSEGLDFLGSYRERVMSLLEAKGVTVYSQACLEEAVGEGMVKAVKIQPLKVFSSQLVFIDSGFSPNRNFFDEPITVNDSLTVGFPGLYFLGDCAREVLDQDQFFIANRQVSLQKEAELFADFILSGAKEVFPKPPYEFCSKPEIIDNFLSQVEGNCPREVKNL
ncbi:MAG: NAD(P)/FAD-dependent oxidoreductase [Candidatus Omnitrophica bacterium]|nr:NAD(P)/FAD-dependent oxidoreductase [Candidatus Omnitrophota bacterium]MBU2044912.1 NAD(P)/FAD-dependent oxidoreductase [Candidatus Omnitrophota bacterium]MBU2251538.1 NAD(P)/FAD-dependent oxidoreductase [Candidatus Omnitrophota bacterium]MBU2473872.1 NAD(P)/FAD-dependent oxidoreductase [Candidatus Omnitrophota bacterium]